VDVGELGSVGTKTAAGKSPEVTHLSLLSAKTAGQTGRATLAVSSTWYAFAGKVSSRRTHL
jgi:hypothetical protein